MSTEPRDPEDRSESEPELDEELETTNLDELEDEAFRTVDGAYSDEPADPAFEAVIEAGGGVSEGFEQAEAELVDHALDEDGGNTGRVLRDAPGAEAEPDRAVYGEADDERASERPD